MIIAKLICRIKLNDVYIFFDVYIFLQKERERERERERKRKRERDRHSGKILSKEHMCFY